MHFSLLWIIGKLFQEDLTEYSFIENNIIARLLIGWMLKGICDCDFHFDFHSMFIGRDFMVE